MKRCGARPYKGKEKYIFISYSHQDKPQVFPIIERLARDGYRVWYDDGIDPGSEWPTTIAEHLMNCEVCIPLISENSLQSANCHQEITYALKKNKKIIAAMLEDVTLPAGLDMQLSVIQKVHKFTQTDEEFFQRLYDGEILKPCLGKPNPSVRVSVPEDYVKDKPKALSAKSEENAAYFQEKEAKYANRAEEGGRKNSEATNYTASQDWKDVETTEWMAQFIEVTDQLADLNVGEPECAGQSEDLKGRKPESADQSADLNGGEPEHAGQSVDLKGRKPESADQSADLNGGEPECAGQSADLNRGQAKNAGQTKEKNRKEKKNSTAKGWRKYLPPGYRTGKIWHMLVATYYYATVIVSLVASTGSDMLENIVIWMFCIVLFFGSAAIWGNYLECWQKIPLMKNKYARILGFVLYPLLIFIVMSVLALIILAFAGVY